MHDQHTLFPAGATASIRRKPARSRALVVLQAIPGFRLIDHPVIGGRYSGLMVQDGEADLTGRIKPSLLVRELLSLPGVIPPGTVVSPDGYVTVPLLRPDAPDGTNITSWTISSSLRLDQIGARRAYLYLTGADGPEDVVTRDLLPDEWWLLIRALVSLDKWMTHLVGALDDLSAVVRERCLPPSAKRVQILHHNDGLWKEVFSYEETSELDDLTICEQAFETFNVGEDERAAAYRAKDLRSLSSGDAVVIDGTTYLCEPRGWTKRVQPLLIMWITRP